MATRQRKTSKGPDRFPVFSACIIVVALAVLAILRGPRDGCPRSHVPLARADIRRISAALELYKADWGTYPPDTGYGLDMSKSPGTYDPGSLWRYLTKPTYDPQTGRRGGPYLEWDEERLIGYVDSTGAWQLYLADPWGGPYGFIGAPDRVIHNRESFDLFSAGMDGETACNNGVDDSLADWDMVVDCSTDPLSDWAVDNRAYNGLDDDANSIADDREELGGEAMLNGTMDDDVSNWDDGDPHDR